MNNSSTLDDATTRTGVVGLCLGVALIVCVGPGA